MNKSLPIFCIDCVHIKRKFFTLKRFCKKICMYNPAYFFKGAILYKKNYNK